MKDYETLLHEQNYWPLQVIQDEYACALDLPLRIYKPSAIVNLYEELQKKESLFKNLFSTQKAFHDYVTAIATAPLENKEQLKKDKDLWEQLLPNKKQQSCWLTTQSAGYFLIHSFQESPLWRLWEFFFFYHHYHQFIIFEKIEYKQESKEKNYYTAYYFDHPLCSEKQMHLAFKPLSLREVNEYILVAGPVWQTIETIAGSDFEKKRVKPVVQTILEFIDNEITTRESALVRMGNSRFPMTSKYLCKQLERAVDSLKQILKTTLPDKQYDIHRCDHVKLAEWALFTLRIDKSLSSDKIWDKLKEGHAIYARLDHPEILKTKHKMSSPWVKTTWQISDEDKDKRIPQFHIQYKKPQEENRIESLHIALPQNFEDRCKKRIEISFTTFLNQILTQRSARKTGALLVLRKWLNNRFRIVVKKDDTIEIYEWLCRWIADQVTADQVTLYYYNHGQQYVKKLGFYGKTDESEKWKNAILGYMKSAAKNDEKRHDSICYRCIDEHRVQFTRMFDPETKRAIPDNQPILLPPKGIENSNRSAIATPIFVFGRVWGVLEVNGIYPYQFCWNNTTFLEELTSIFSPFFYQQHLLDRLQKLNKISVEEKTLPEIYKDITHQLAVIFLSHSATLWLSEQNCQYKCVGWYNRPDIDQDLSGKNEWEKVDNDIIKDVIGKNKPYYQEVIGEKLFDKNWIKSQAIGFQELNIKHVCIIPIYKLDGTTPMGSLFLYNQTDEGFDERWLSIISRVSQQVTLLLEAMEIQQKKEKLRKNILAHEIKRYANFIEDRAINLTKYVSRHFKPNPDQKHRLHNLTHDIEIHSKDLLHDIECLSSDDYKPRAHEHPLVSTAIATLRKPKQFINFREQFNSQARSYWEKQKSKQFKIHDDYAGFSSEQEIYIEMHAYNFRKILGNLLDNAIKYNLSDNAIEAQLTLTKHKLEFVISNRCPCLKEDEEFRIFDEKFRGVGSTNVEGKGLGLFVVKQICDLYNIGLRYKAEPDPYIRASCLHHFILSFPRRLVKLLKKGENF